ncbi:MAG TPA: LysR family transcriptional regulator [Polyangiaceae bacterium]|nr:LysR family transcriptional regulator [Polyangiaceae bacterium]
MQTPHAAEGAPARLEALNVNLLLALHWLLTEQSVTRAARAMGVTQSAMSRSLAQLRELFDDPLLVSAGRVTLPTARATALSGPLARAIDGLRAVLRLEPSFEPATARGSLRLAATEHALCGVALDLALRARRLAPGVDLQLEPATRDVFTQLAAGRLDFLIVPAVPNRPPGLACATVLDERFVSIVRRGHPLRGRALTLRRFVELPHVVVHPLGGESEGTVGAALRERGLERRVALRVPYFSTALRAVASSDMIATVPESVTRTASARGLEVREPPLHVPGFQLEAVWHLRSEDDPRIAWLRDLLRSPRR